MEAMLARALRWRGVGTYRRPRPGRDLLDRVAACRHPNLLTL